MSNPTGSALASAVLTREEKLRALVVKWNLLSEAHKIGAGGYKYPNYPKGMERGEQLANKFCAKDLQEVLDEV